MTLNVPAKKPEKKSEKKPERKNDKWIKVLQSDGQLKATALHCGDALREAQKRHGITDPRLVHALGEAFVAALLLASRRKPTEKISLSVKGDGYLQQVIVDAQPEGFVRGFIVSRESHAAIDPKEVKLNEEFGIGPWGEGLISVVTLLQENREPYVGTCELATGHLAKDLTLYMNQSEQIPSAVGLAVKLDPQTGLVDCAGGFLIEVLPGASESSVAMIENNLKHMNDLAKKIAESATPVQLLGGLFTEKSFTILEEKAFSFHCNCSRDRVKRALNLIDAKELKDMAEEDQGAKVKCDFCNTEYAFSRQDLEEMVTAKKSGSK